VVDVDVAVRESLELPIQNEAWQPEIFEYQIHTETDLGRTGPRQHSNSHTVPTLGRAGGRGCDWRGASALCTYSRNSWWRLWSI